jgi:hypothetical protein
MTDDIIVKVNGEDYIKYTFPFVASEKGKNLMDRFNKTRDTLGVIEVSTVITRSGGLFTNGYGHITALVPASKIKQFYKILEDKSG